MEYNFEIEKEVYEKLICNSCKRLLLTTETKLVAGDLLVMNYRGDEVKKIIKFVERTELNNSVFVYFD